MLGSTVRFILIICYVIYGPLDGPRQSGSTIGCHVIRHGLPEAMEARGALPDKATALHGYRNARISGV